MVVKPRAFDGDARFLSIRPWCNTDELRGGIHVHMSFVRGTTLEQMRASYKARLLDGDYDFRVLDESGGERLRISVFGEVYVDGELVVGAKDPAFRKFLVKMLDAYGEKDDAVALVDRELGGE